MKSMKINENRKSLNIRTLIFFFDFQYQSINWYYFLLIVIDVIDYWFSLISIVGLYLNFRYLSFEIDTRNCVIDFYRFPIIFDLLLSNSNDNDRLLSTIEIIDMLRPDIRHGMFSGNSKRTFWSKRKRAPDATCFFPLQPSFFYNATTWNKHYFLELCGNRLQNIWNI